MSAFLCSDRHTAVVALLIGSHGLSTVVDGDSVSELRRANNAALAHRYGDKPQRLKNRAKALEAAQAWLDSRPHPMDRLRVVECFEYQCGEGDTLDTAGPHGFTAVALKALQRLLLAEAKHAAPLNSQMWAI